MKKMIFGNKPQPGNSTSQTTEKNKTRTTLTIPGKMPKQGYLYIPFAAEDMIHQSLGLNLLRHLKGKELYPLIAPNQNIRNEMLKLRTAEIANLEAQINIASDKLQEVDTHLKDEAGWSADTLRNTLSADTFDKFTTSIARLSQQLSVLQNMSFIHKPLSQLSCIRDKLYILGHGTAGGDILAADEAATLGQMTAKTLAAQLHASGLPKTFRDIRVTACYSADAFKPGSFAANELDKSAGMVSDKRGGISGLFPPTKGSYPLAQMISRELKRLGYNNIQVTGYHGAGVTYSQTEFRARRIHGVPDIRRSLVKRGF